MELHLLDALDLPPPIVQENVVAARGMEAADTSVDRREFPMLMRFDPFRDIDRMAQSLGQSSGGRTPAVMAMDAYRDGDDFVVHFDLPGVEPSTIDLTVEKNVLTVSAERRWRASEDQHVLVSERPQGTFTRQLFLGDTLDAERIEASSEDGVLTLRIPISEQAKPRKVEVTGGGQRQTIDTTSKEE